MAWLYARFAVSISRIAAAAASDARADLDGAQSPDVPQALQVCVGSAQRHAAADEEQAAELAEFVPIRPAKGLTRRVSKSSQWGRSRG